MIQIQLLSKIFAEKESEYFSKPGKKWEGLPINELVLTPPEKLTNILFYDDTQGKNLNYYFTGPRALIAQT
jgi:hypothetical protein